MLPSHQLFLTRHSPSRERTFDLPFSFYIAYYPSASFLTGQRLTKHMEAMNRILRYLRTTPGKGFNFQEDQQKVH